MSTSNKRTKTAIEAFRQAADNAFGSVAENQLERANVMVAEPGEGGGGDVADAANALASFRTSRMINSLPTHAMSRTSNQRTKTTVANANQTYDIAINSATDLLGCKQLQDNLKRLLERANAKAVELGGGEDDMANVASVSNNDTKKYRMKNG
ncbi:hypothetical protein ACHAWF_003174, partial [Thalassiosira exigua]